MWDSRAEVETAPPSVTTAGAVIAQNVELAHAVAWAVTSTAGPDGWDAIWCSQLAGVARWTWPHNSGRPTGNIWPLSSSVATSLTNESFIRAGEYTTTSSASSRPLSLAGWASARPIGAEDAAIPRLRPKHRSTCRALVEVQAGVGRHRFGLLMQQCGQVTVAVSSVMAARCSISALILPRRGKSGHGGPARDGETRHDIEFFRSRRFATPR